MNGAGKQFMKMTRYENMEDSDQNKGIAQPPIERPYDSGKELIELPPPEEFEDNGITLEAAINNRRSIRKYANKPLSMAELGYLLWNTQGIKEVLKWEGEHGPLVRTLRTVPSAGARHAFETYLLINNVEGLAPGLYRYISTAHKLQQVDFSPNIADRIADACLKQVYVKNCAVTFIWAADIYRMAWRYGERGYRYLFLDAGHVCQNLYLAAGAIGCGACAIDAFEDQKLNDLLSLDGENDFAVYIATVGKLIG